MKFKSGIYIPINKEKYKHFDNFQNSNVLKYPKYRSSYELKFCKFCDTNPKVLQWSSEPFYIEYFNPVKNRKAKYFPDFLVIFENFKFLIEIKPDNQTKPGNSMYSNLTYKVNSAKWEAANQYAINNGYIFKIITNLELFGV